MMLRSARVPRLSPLLCCTLAALPLLSFAPCSLAQGSNPITQMMVTESSVSDATTQTVTNFCEQMAQAFASGDPAAITQARRLHVENLRRASSSGASPAFATLYQQQVADSFSGVFDDATELAQINMMLTLQGVRTEPALELMIQAIENAPPAVQYLAGQGLVRAYTSNATTTLSPDVGRSAVTALRGAISDATDAPVTQSLIVALSVVPEGFTPAVQELQARITAKQGNQSVDVSGETQALLGMVQQLDRQGNYSGLQTQYRGALAAGYRLAQLIASQAAALPADDPAVSSLADALKRIEADVLRPIARNAFNASSLPSNIADAVDQRQWTTVQSTLASWQTTLTNPPIGLRENQITGP